MGILAKTYEALAGAGRYTARNFVLFRSPLGHAFGWWWGHNGGDRVEGAALRDAQAIKQSVGIPVICTGGFQTASIVRNALRSGACDGVSIARSLVANNDLVELWRSGLDRAPRPCTYCNKCLANATENPLGCYEESRFDSREEMVAQIMSVFDPPPFPKPAAVLNE
jgi:2,4-dienoyl-CoA reductase (NADPH2)